VDARRSDEPRTRKTVSWINWQSALYLFVLGATCLVLVPLTSLWWLVLVFGAMAPVALAALERPGLAFRKPVDRKVRERELLHALDERGELTPAAAAMRTPLTVDEASKMLEELARKGHLEPRDEDGVVSYVLRERRRGPDGEPPSLEAGPEGGVTLRQLEVSRQLEDPLSERELEVLVLLASGRTNAEIARELYVALGTVKSHTGNIYRKLEAKNRAEALNRARELGLIR
jgi:DNA-binding CsgD family transcriptional regulator